MDRKIAVVGLGYVGLPLVVGFGRKRPVIGFDVDAGRVEELRAGHDRTGEVSEKELTAAQVEFTADEADLRKADFHIVAVPTPIDAANRPELSLLVHASEIVGRHLQPGAIVVYESTVYPGVTEEVCLPVLERASGMTCGRDFAVGYSPERINPGDREHTLERITKVVSAMDEQTLDIVAAVYGEVVPAGIYRAASIKTAEAAKVIENTQRDLNIALMNELAMIFHRLELDTTLVLEAAGTKWNFLPFRPGLVGGHCIGVDPYYLTYKAEAVGYHPQVILAGRRINDGMGAHVADYIGAELSTMFPGDPGTDVLVLGLTFKEDVSDLRNSKVVELIDGLRARGCRVRVHDPLADPGDAQEAYGIELLSGLESSPRYDCVVGAVAHSSYRAFTSETFARLLRPGGLVADIKGMWRDIPLPDGLRRWQL